MTDGAAEKAAARERWRWVEALTFDPALSPFDCRVGMAILHHVNNDSGKAWPSKRLIAERIGAKERSVKRSVKKLVELGHFHQLRQGGGRAANGHGLTSIYQLDHRRAAEVKGINNGDRGDTLDPQTADVAA